MRSPHSGSAGATDGMNAVIASWLYRGGGRCDCKASSRNRGEIVWCSGDHGESDQCPQHLAGCLPQQVFRQDIRVSRV